MPTGIFRELLLFHKPLSFFQVIGEMHFIKNIENETEKHGDNARKNHTSKFNISEFDRDAG